jgi:hypothetical protein
VQIVHKTLSRKILHKNTAGGVAQSIGPEFKPQYCQKRKKEIQVTKEKERLIEN